MSGRSISEKEFNILKKLINNGASQNEFIEATGRGHATYSRIKHCETYKEYKKYVEENCGIYKSLKDKKKAEPKKKLSRHDEIMEHYTEIAHHLVMLGKLLGEE